MSTLPEQFSAARKSQGEAQITFFQNAASSAVEHAEKILALNVSTTRATLEASSAAVRELLSAKDPRDLLALTNPAQANLERMLAYGRQLVSIATGSQAALLKQAVPVIAPSAPERAPDVVRDVAPETAPEIAPEIAPEVALAIVPDVVPDVVPEVVPQAAPMLAPEAQAAPVPVAKATPAAPPAAKAKPIAKAVGNVGAKAAPAKPAAAPLPASPKPVVVTTLKAVEAARPPSGKSTPDDKQLDMLAPKTRKKK